MKCTGCGFETEDDVEFLCHMIECETKPEESWRSYAEFGDDLQPLPMMTSDLLKVKEE